MFRQAPRLRQGRSREAKRVGRTSRSNRVSIAGRRAPAASFFRYLAGRADLIAERNGTLELVDFKVSNRDAGSPHLDSHIQQLADYADMAEHQLGQPVQRLHLYWTGEPNRVRTLLTVDNSRELRVSAVGQTASTVRRIQTRDYRMRAAPVPQVCNGCKLIDLRRADGTLR